MRAHVSALDVWCLEDGPYHGKLRNSYCYTDRNIKAILSCPDVRGIYKRLPETSNEIRRGRRRMCVSASEKNTFVIQRTVVYSYVNNYVIMLPKPAALLFFIQTIVQSSPFLYNSFLQDAT